MGCGRQGLRVSGNVLFPLVLLAICLGRSNAACAQVVPAADAGGLTVSAGGTASYYYVGYGERKLLGVTGFFDAETRRHMGIEGEARFLEFHQTANVHDETYLLGPRYSFHAAGRFYAYAKALVGFGKFNFSLQLRNRQLPGDRAGGRSRLSNQSSGAFAARRR